MATSSLSTHSSELVRLSPDDLIRIVDEAVLLVESATTRDREKRLEPARVYLQHLREIGDTESAAEEQAALEKDEAALKKSALPQWRISSRGENRMETREASAEEVVPTLGIPRPHGTVSVGVGAGGQSLEIRLGSFGARITVQSTDASWAMHASLWAAQKLGEITPRRSWIMRPATVWMFALAGTALGAVALIFPVMSEAMALREAIFITLGAGLIAATVGLALRSLPGTILSSSLGARWREFRREGTWVLVGGVVGVALSEVWGLIFKH